MVVGTSEMSGITYCVSMSHILDDISSFNTGRHGVAPSLSFSRVKQDKSSEIEAKSSKTSPTPPLTDQTVRPQGDAETDKATDQDQPSLGRVEDDSTAADSISVTAIAHDGTNVDMTGTSSQGDDHKGSEIPEVSLQATRDTDSLHRPYPNIPAEQSRKQPFETQQRHTFQSIEPGSISKEVARMYNFTLYDNGDTCAIDTHGADVSTNHFLYAHGHHSTNYLTMSIWQK